MLVSFTSAKADKIRQACLFLFRKRLRVIRQLAEVIGQLVPAQPGVRIAPLFFKRLEFPTDCVLKAKNGNFDANIEVPRVAKGDLACWIDNLDRFSCPVKRNKPSVYMKSDASKRGRERNVMVKQ